MSRDLNEARMQLDENTIQQFLRTVEATNRFPNEELYTVSRNLITLINQENDLQRLLTVLRLTRPYIDKQQEALLERKRSHACHIYFYTSIFTIVIYSRLRLPQFGAGINLWISVVSAYMGMILASILLKFTKNENPRQEKLEDLRLGFVKMIAAATRRRLRELPQLDIDPVAQHSLN